MAVEYQHDIGKFAYAGLDLNVPVDLVPQTKYSRATNVVSKIEGRMESRDGTTRVASIAPNVPIHTIFRLTQFVQGIVGERLVGAGSVLYTAPLPAGNAFTPLVGPSFDGGPLSILQFRFDGDPGGVWAIIANSQGMMKRRAGYYQALGVPPPTVQATATVGGAGLLNSSTGTPYDWRYTYVNEVTLSESNPSQAMSMSYETKRPTAGSTPDPVVGGSAFSNLGFVFDGNLATAATWGGGGNLASMIVSGWTRSAFQYTALTLYLNMTVISSPAGAVWETDYSTDSGNTWIRFGFSGAGPLTNSTANVSLPPGQDLTKLRVRVSTHTNGIVSANMAIYEIWTAGAINPAVPANLALTNQSANVCVAPPADPQETAIRLYRRGGTLPNNYFQVGQFSVASLAQGGCGPGTLQINDNVADSTAQLGPIMPLDNFQPVQSVQAQNLSLPVIFGPYDTRVLGCGDPARPESVYFSIRGNADIWPAENWVVVGNPGDQMMNGIVYSLRCFAFSRERMFILLPNIIAGVTFTPSETSCRRGLKGRWALCAGKLGVYFGAKDGIYRTQGGPEQSVIDDSIRPLFPVREGTVGKPTNGYDAVDMTDENGLRLAFHNDEIWFFYTGLTTQERQLLIYDEDRSRWRGAEYADDETIVYSEPNTGSSLLLGAVDGDLYMVGGASDGENVADIPVNFRTGAFDEGRPLNLKEYADVIIDVDPGGANAGNPVVITAIMNGETLTELALNVVGAGRQRVPLPLNQTGTEVYAYNIEFDFAWNANASVQPIVYQYDILYRHEPAELTHWELPPTSFGLQGYIHIRDIYLMVRSKANLTLTVTPIGGTVQTFVLPSTGGAKSKLYVQLGPSKGKGYAFSVDSAVPFQIYADESELRVKQWLSKLGYQNVPVIGREQVGKPFGLVNV
jgi:hypothetical protein